MTRNDKDTITRRTENRHLLRRMKAGLMAARDTPHKGLLLTAYLAGAVLVWLFRRHLFGLDAYGMFSPVLNAVIDLLVPLYAVGASWPSWYSWEHPGAAGRQRRACRRWALSTTPERPLSSCASSGTRTRPG